MPYQLPLSAFIRSSHQDQPIWWSITYHQNQTKANCNATNIGSLNTFTMSIGSSHDLVLD